MCSQHAEGPKSLVVSFSYNSWPWNAWMVTKNVKLSLWRMVSYFIKNKDEHFLFYVYRMKIVAHTHGVLPFDVVIDRWLYWDNCILCPVHLSLACYMCMGFILLHLLHIGLFIIDLQYWCKLRYNLPRSHWPEIGGVKVEIWNLLDMSYVHFHAISI